MRHELTEHDIRKMEKEIEHRKVVVRQELLAQVKTARAHGDLSENFEYHAAKKEKNINESRIRYLERMIRNSVIVKEEEEEGTVGINTAVELYFEEDGETDTFYVVTTVLADPMMNRVSIESPIGSSLKGHRTGDRVKIQAGPESGYYVRIESVRSFSDEDLAINRF